MSNTSIPPLKDSFGNPIDSTVGYARGTILRSSIEEGQRLIHAQRYASDRLTQKGAASISVFTGNQRAFPACPEDLELRCEEWFGPGIIHEELKHTVLKHMDAEPTEEVALFNRTSAAIISTIIALSAGRPVVSGVPLNSHSHPSVKRGCRLAQVQLHESSDVESFKQALETMKPALALITTVTSNLDRLEESAIQEMISAAQSTGAIAVVDDAYGARIRPILHGGTSAMRMGADLALTNGDKAGLIGPRAGILVGRAHLIPKVAAQAAEFGMEARAPIMAAMMRSLQAFEPELLREERRLGEELTTLMRKRYGETVVLSSDLGPVIHEDDMLRIVLQRSDEPNHVPSIVPIEATAALGMLLLRDHGILTTNTHGQPGAKASLRLRPTPEALKIIGSMRVVVDALDNCINKVAATINDKAHLSTLILGYTS